MSDQCHKESLGAYSTLLRGKIFASTKDLGDQVYSLRGYGVYFTASQGLHENTRADGVDHPSSHLDAMVFHVFLVQLPDQVVSGFLVSVDFSSRLSQKLSEVVNFPRNLSQGCALGLSSQFVMMMMNASQNIWSAYCLGYSFQGHCWH